MATEVRLPQLGQTMEEGTIVNCMVKVGDEIKKGDVVFEIETDKAVLEMESPTDGFVKYILSEVGQTLSVNEPILILGDRDEEVPRSFVESLKVNEISPITLTNGTAQIHENEQIKPVRKVIASPRAKKLAKELGIELTTVNGTGSAGRITEQDIKRAADLKITFGATIPVNRIQKLTAERMLKSKREIPSYYLTIKADVTDLVSLRTKLNAHSDVKISYNDFIIRAVAIAIKKYPFMTGQMEGDTIKLSDAINIGLAVSAPDGLIIPVLKDVDKEDVKQIAADSNYLIEKARNKKLLLTDLEGSCITVSNLGGFGIESFIPIVVPGQCSTLGVGKIIDTCVPENKNFKVRKLMSLSLSVDHKIVNGVYAAQFLNFVKELLEDTSRFQ